MRLSITLVVVCLAGILLLTVLIIGRQAHKDEDLAIRQATRSIESMLTEAESVMFMNQAFLGQPCTLQLARQLSRSAALSTHVRDVRLLKNNITMCASLDGSPDLPALPEGAGEHPVLLLMPGDKITPAASLLVMVRQYAEGGVAVSLNGLFLRQVLKATADRPGLLFRTGGLEMGADGMVHSAQNENATGDTTRLGRYAFTVVADPRSPVRGGKLLKDALPSVLFCLLVIAAVIGIFQAWLSQRGREDTRLRRAIMAGNIRPWYQPVVDSHTGKPAGCEVLARWYTRCGKIITPDRFIPLAESSGLIIPLTQSLLKQVACELGVLRELLPPDFHLAFNLSASHAADDSLLDTCRALQSALPGVILVAEITERERFEPSADLPDLLPRLRATGVRVALDDFGTGYASLSTLDQLPVDYIKLDRTFTKQISQLSSASKQLLMAEMVTEMAHRMKLEVVAEGVETAWQRDWLRTHGVKWLQGYFYSRPLPLKDFAAYLRNGSLDSRYAKAVLGMTGRDRMSSDRHLH